MQFGVSLPTCTEGMAYPIPFTDHQGILRVAQEVEQLGYDSVLVNDHFSTMTYVRDGFPEPPRYYEPMVTLTYVASHTSRVRLMTGVVVMPMRDPVLLAKQVACLDQISGGRVTLGVGVGAYREEFESVRPDLAHAPRAELVAEGLESMKLLFEQRRASFHGKHYRFEDVEMYPKPLQTPFPLYSSGNADGTLRRAARLCEGWMPAGLPVDRLAAGVAKLRGYAAEAGRDPDALDVAPQMVMCIGPDTETAVETFQRSQVYEHLVSLQKTTLKGIDVQAYVSQNLIGNPDEICRRVEALGEAGAKHLSGLIVVANTLDEMLAQVRMFAAEVLPAFAGTGRTAS